MAKIEEHTRMANDNIPSRKMAWRRAVYLLLFFATSAAAAPVIQQASGTLNHIKSITITGSGFGSKEVAAPVVWDDASGTNILNKWDGAWPNAGNSAYYTRYTTPIRGISLPHNHISKYIAGAHGDSAGAN